MAASDVDIVNLALGHLGDAANVTAISPSDGSVQADHASRFYAQIRDWLLERFAWKFATRRATLAERADITIGSWRHVYNEPNNCLRILSVLATGYTNDRDGQPFDTESDNVGQGLILTDAKNATARFIFRVSDPARFTPGFTETLSWALAAALAGPIIKGETGRQEALRCLQMAQATFASAAAMSANQARQTLDFIPSGISARGNYDLSTLDDPGSFPVRGF